MSLCGFGDFLTFYQALDENDIQILKTYVRYSLIYRRLQLSIFTTGPGTVRSRPQED